MVDNLPPVVVAAVISSLIGVVSVFGNYVISRKKTNADAASAISTAAGNIVRQYRIQLEAVQHKLDIVEKNLADCQRQHSQKEIELRELKNEIQNLREMSRLRNTLSERI